MTALTRNVRRETSATHKGRSLMIDAGCHGVTIRQKGRRNGYWVPWEAVFSCGAKLQVIAERREKAARKKGK